MADGQASITDKTSLQGIKRNCIVPSEMGRKPFVSQDGLRDAPLGL